MEPVETLSELPNTATASKPIYMIYNSNLNAGKSKPDSQFTGFPSNQTIHNPSLSPSKNRHTPPPQFSNPYRPPDVNAQRKTKCKSRGSPSFHMQGKPETDNEPQTGPATALKRKKEKKSPGGRGRGKEAHLTKCTMTVHTRVCMYVHRSRSEKHTTLACQHDGVV
jgi:hypothetical protein